MPNPFKKIQQNAEQTKSKKQWEGAKTNSNTNTKTCNCCGAPRPINTNLTRCSYCHFEFMTIDTKITPDN